MIATNQTIHEITEYFRTFDYYRDEFLKDLERVKDDLDAVHKDHFWNTSMNEAVHAVHNNRTKRSPVLNFRTVLSRYIPAVRRPNIPYVFLSQGRPRINSLGAVQVRTGADPRAIVYRSRGIAAGLPPRPRYK